MRAGERPSALIRRIEIGLPRALEDVRRDERGDQWPYRCATHASVLTHALFEAHSDDPNERLFSVLASRAASALEEGQLRTGARDRLSYLDEVFEMATMIHLPAGAAAHGPLPPAAANPLSPHRMTPLFASQGAATVVATESVSSATMRVVLGAGDRALSVIPSGSGGDAVLASVRCHSMPNANAPSTVQVLSGDDDAPAVVRVAPASGDAFLRREDGTFINAGSLGDGGYVLSSGRVVAMLAATSSGSPWRLQTFADSVPEISPVAAPFAAQVARGLPLIIGNQVISIAGEPASDPALPQTSRADASAVDATTSDATAADAASPSLGATLWTGTIVGSTPPSTHWESRGSIGPLAPDVAISACRTEAMIAVAVRDHTDRVGLSFETHGQWSVPVMADVARGAFTCRGTEAAFTWIENRPHRWLHQLRCTPQGCAESHASFPTFPGDVQPVATDLDGNVLMLWSPGPGRGMQFLLAPLADLATAVRRVVFDDADHGGLATSPEIPVFVRRDAAVVLVSTTAEPFTTYAVRIDAHGSFTPVRHPGS